MPRRLIVCADGTWNTEGRIVDRKLVQTNVRKIYEAIRTVGCDGREQHAHYIAGVGTHGLVDSVLGGIGGYGISGNICEGYRFLVNNYEEGDEIFLFGFSRGAYTVRSLAGLIRNCGLLHEYHAHRLPEAYALYRDRSEDAHPSEKRARLFRRSYARKVTITCLGVWDTVGSLGIPDSWIGARLNPALKLRNQFHDVTLSSWVEHAYHAIAIDERRKPFMPTLWQTQDIAGQEVEQCWFPGVHSDVGGGYPDTSLSDIALDWMMRRAERCGLEFKRKHRTLAPSPTGTLHESLNPFYERFGVAQRPIPPIARHAFDRHGDPKRVIHESAFARMRHEFAPPATAYYPSNLLAYLADPYAAGAPAQAPAAAQVDPAAWVSPLVFGR
jgi:uncharacterized protein (DUF2235 family)